MRGIRLSSMVAVLLLGGAMVSAAGQTPAPAAPSGESKTTEQQFKNVQVLKGIPAEELLPAMRYITGALGVECEYCHVTEPQRAFDKDDKKPKQTARQMMQMVKSINDANFGGRSEVTCATCHQGHARPQALPPIATLESLKERLEEAPRRPRAGGPQQASAPAATAQEAMPTLPQASDLFANYEQAIGGDAAVAKMTSRYLKGTITTARGQALQIEAYSKAPDKLLSRIVINDKQSRETAYDGAQAWTRDRAVHPLSGLDADAARLEAAFYRNFRLDGLYRLARTVAKEKIGDKDVYMVRAAVKGGRFSEMLYFDAASGLLLRRTTLTRTVLGPLPEQVDFQDYREVDGVKIASTVVRSNSNNVLRAHYDEIKINVPVQDAQFAMPKVEAGGGER